MNSKFFIDRPILSIALAVVILLLGFLGYGSLPVEQLPDIAPPVVEVSAEYAGASADAVQKSVIIPIEEAVNGVDGIDEIISSSNSSGSASIAITFKPGIDPDMATVLVKNRMTEVEGILPQEVIETGVHVGKEQRSYLRLLALESVDGRYDNDFITNFFDINISPRLQRIKGVGHVELLGSVYAMRIWLDPKKMAAYHLAPKDIEDILEAQNTEVAIGTLGEDSKSTFQYSLVYRGRLANAEEFGNIVLRSENDGDDLRLRDVARCEIGTENYATYNQVNGHPGVVAIITQANGSNAQQVNKEIDQLLEEAKPHLPPGLEYRTLLDTNDFLDASMKEVDKTLFETIVLVVLVVLVFLKNARATLIPAIAIIVSLLGTFAFMYVAGFTLNLITLFALVLVIGTVVDDAIIVVEAVLNRFEAGEQRSYEATLQAMRQIGTAVITTTVVFMIVFIPISFINGLIGTYYRQFGLTMAVAVAISTLNALTLSPTLCVLLLRNNNEARKGKLFTAFNVAFATMTGKYHNGINNVFRHKWLVPGLTALVFLLLAALTRYVPTSLIPDEDTGNIFVDINTPAGSTLEQTKKAVNLAAEKVKGIDGIEHCASVAGWNILSADGANSGMLIIKLKHWDERSGSDQKIDAVIEQIEERLDCVKTASMFTFALPTVTGYGLSNSIELYVQDFDGQSIAKTKEVTDRFVEALDKREEIGEAYCSYEINFPQYTVSVNAAICKRYGVEPSAVLNELNGYIGSNYATQFNAFGKMYHVVMQADPQLRRSIDDLNNIFLVVDENKYIPIKELVSFKKSYGVQSLNRFNLYSAIGVEVSPEDGYSTGEAMKAIEEVAQKVLPQGYGYEFTGTAQEEIKTSKNRTWVLLIVIIFVYIVLCALYESLLIPLAVLMSIPFGIFGSFLFAMLFHAENNIYMQVGVIMLIGLLAKTAILLTGYATERRREGMTIHKAAIAAAKARLRPILMTALTLIIGLLPLPFSSGAVAVGNTTLGLCVIGGMIVGTLAILFLVPLFFMFFQYLDENYMPKRMKPAGEVPLVLTLFMLSSCGTYYNYRNETISTDSLLRNENTNILSTTQDSLHGWREMFTEPNLVTLIEEGLAHNSDLSISKLHVDAAKAELCNAKGELFPSLELGGSGQTSRFKNNAKYEGSENTGAQTDNTFYFGAEASWEADIFGKLQSAKKAAAASVEERMAYMQAVQVELIATIATSYYQLEMYDAQIAETRTIMENWDESIMALKALMAVGETTSDEVAQAEAERLGTEIILEELQMQMIQAENSLCTLLGRPCGHINRGDFLISCQKQKHISQVSIKALANRPDIRQAEAVLKRTFHATNEARAALYPSLNLSGSIGWTNDIGEVVSPAGLITRALASLTQPVFAKGRLRAAVRQAQAEQEEAKINFRQAILNAGKEANDIIAMQQYAQKAILLNSQQIEKLTNVLATTEKRMRYDSEVNYLQVLLARQSLLKARLSLLSNHYALVESHIALYRALGGGSAEIPRPSKKRNEFLCFVLNFSYLCPHETSSTQEKPRSALPDRPEHSQAHRRHGGCLS
ncbi:MAG: efflux RND transporter permease subunit [Prevotella sp.]|nr:efflux RND transporter permease subunit [Prevotella sp.]